MLLNSREEILRLPILTFDGNDSFTRLMLFLKCDEFLPLGNVQIAPMPLKFKLGTSTEHIQFLSPWFGV